MSRDRHHVIRGLRGRIRVVPSPDTESTDATDHEAHGAPGAVIATALSVASVAASVSCPPWPHPCRASCPLFDNFSPRD